MAYIDGFVVPVPTARRDDYIKASETFSAVFREAGALKVVEGWGDDVPDGVTTSFPMAVKLQPGETVVFSWVLWSSKAARDVGNAKVRDDPRMAMTPDMPFDGKRMIYGGFEIMGEF